MNGGEVMPFYRSHERVYTPVGTVSMTKQSHKDECDINNILSQYKKTGIITHINNNKSEYIDLPEDVDYQKSVDIVMQADHAFSTLPSKVRDFFKNDPFEFLAAYNDPAMHDRLVEFGLLAPPKQPSPVVVGGPPAPAVAEPPATTEKK